MHLVDESDVFAGELAPGTRQRLQMSVDERLARSVEVTGGQLRAQRGGLAGEVGRVGRGFILDTLPQRGITGEGIDVPAFNTVKSQPEQQVFGDDTVLRLVVIAHVTQP